MKDNAIIAAWMSPESLIDYTVYNQLLILTAIGVKYVMGLLNGSRVGWQYFVVSARVNEIFGYLYSGMGVYALVSGITLLVLANLGRYGEIDTKRLIKLWILGLVNMVQAIYIMKEVFV